MNSERRNEFVKSPFLIKALFRLRVATVVNTPENFNEILTSTLSLSGLLPPLLVLTKTRKFRATFIAMQSPPLQSLRSDKFPRKVPASVLFISLVLIDPS